MLGHRKIDKSNFVDNKIQIDPVLVINRNDRRSNGGVAGAQQPNAQQQQQLQPSQRQQQLANLQPNSIKQVNKVRPNVNRQPTDSRDAISPSTYNR